jgi:signal transduction histidine kinase
VGWAATPDTVAMAATLSIDTPARFQRDTAAARIAAACDGARRRLERDLHDGAQQRLVALALRLRVLGTQLEPGSEAERLLGSAQQELAEALSELRDLAHGLHPSALSERGLGAALTTLAARATVPVELDVRLDDRPPEAVEVAAYYVVSECLANIAKYAYAERADVSVAVVSGELVVAVADDGIGGAVASEGSGLEGLADRVGALDGRLAVWSPAGGGTVVEARIPLVRCVPPRGAG